MVTGASLSLSLYPCLYHIIKKLSAQKFQHFQSHHFTLRRKIYLLPKKYVYEWMGYATISASVAVAIVVAAATVIVIIQCEHFFWILHFHLAIFMKISCHYLIKI